MGAPTTYTQAFADEIVAWVSEGKPLRAYCRQNGKPGKSTITDWRKAHPEFDKRFLAAREEGADEIAQDALDILDEEPERIQTEQGVRIDPAHVQYQKNRAEGRVKLLAKWFPAKYGDKVDMNHSGSVGFSLRVRRQAEQDDGAAE